MPKCLSNALLAMALSLPALASGDELQRYADPRHGFSLSHPPGFAVQPQDLAKLPQFKTFPLASIFFMNPTMAAGALAGIEPPDLEVRVYPAHGAKSLQNWLLSSELSSRDSVAAAKPYRNPHADGLKICQTTLIAPGCSVYLLHEDRVYQLTAISQEGEAMIDTFAFSPH